MVLPIFTANGGHLGFFDFYGSDFNRLFMVITVFSRIENRRETFCYIFWGVRWYIDPSIDQVAC